MATVENPGESGDGLGVGAGPGDWPLWVDIGVPMLSIALFIGVNIYLYLTHRPPSEQEDLPLAGMSATDRGTQAAENPHYGSTVKDKQTTQPDGLVPVDNLALTISMEETSFSAAVREPVPGTSNATLTPHAYSTADYSACAGACASRSTEPLVASMESNSEKDPSLVP